MKRLLATLALTLSLVSPLSAQDHEAKTTTRLRLRARPSFQAELIAIIPAGQTVTLGTCADGWCKVAWRREDGYAAERYLSDGPASDTPTQGRNGRGYTNVDDSRVRSPVRASSVPAGASARCRDGTYSFSAHRRGTCSHHGGVAVWL